MDEENFIWTNPEDVPAEIQPNGEVTENNTGEQVANEGGNPVWWDETYPGQTIQDPNAVKENVFDPRQEVQESVFNPAAAVPDPYAGLTPEQKIALGGADPTDPYIRARLGISQLPDSPLGGLPSTSNFFNSIRDVATSATPTIQKALSALTTKTPGASPYAQPATVQKSLSALTSNAASPTQDAYGLNILDAEQTQQLTRNINPAFINNLVDPNAGTKGVFVARDGVAFDLETGISVPVVNGQQVIPPAVLAGLDPAARDRIAQYNNTPIISATAVNPGQSNLAGPPDTFIKDANGDWVENPLNQNARVVAAQPITDPAAKSTAQVIPTTSAAPVKSGNPSEIYTDTRQTAQDAARLNEFSEFPDPYLTKITQAQKVNDVAEAEIAKSQPLVDQYKSNIDTATVSLAQTQTRIDATTDPDLQAALLQQQQQTLQYIDQQTKLLDQAKANVKQNTDIVQANNDIINENAQAYKDSKKTVTTDQVPVDTTKGIFPVEIGDLGATDDSLGKAGEANSVITKRLLAQQQAVLAQQRKIANNQDWRVRLSLAPNSTYLYNDPNNTILQPLRVTGGVIFPYTPKIEMSYKADYEAYALTHSNAKGYFYKNSYVDPVNMSAVFTAQDSQEAQYLLAVIHFFRSVTKMFYGQDKNPIAGTPPPVVFLRGLGQYQFDNKPCVVTSFNLNLPADVDYIRANSLNIDGTNMLTRRNLQDLPTNPISGAVARLQNLWNSQRIMPGADKQPPQVPSLSQNQPSYVPTKIEFQISLLPVQSRRQMSRQFSLQKYASGALLGAGYDSTGNARSNKGFW